jgi:hypothetical protein
MSRILESRDHFSSISVSLYPRVPASSTHRSVMSLPMRPALAFAIDASIEFGSRLSAIQAAASVRSSADSQSASIWMNVAAAWDCTEAGRS